jgi:uncharacterized Rmd1/YagE family protein
MDEIPESFHPELFEKYHEIREIFKIDELSKSVNNKLSQIADTYSFMRDTVSTSFFIFLEIFFLLWLGWGVIDTLLLWRISGK